MKKNIRWSVVVLIVVVFLSYVFDLHTKIYNFINQESNVRQELPLPNVPIKEYILGAKVTSVSESSLNISVDRVFAGPNGNYIATENKIVVLSVTTKIYITKMEAGKYSKTSGRISDIKVGDNIQLYSDQNIARMDSFAPYALGIVR